MSTPLARTFYNGNFPKAGIAINAATKFAAIVVAIYGGDGAVPTALTLNGVASTKLGSTTNTGGEEANISVFSISDPESGSIAITGFSDGIGKNLIEVIEYDFYATITDFVSQGFGNRSGSTFTATYNYSSVTGEEIILVGTCANGLISTNTPSMSANLNSHFTNAIPVQYVSGYDESVSTSPEVYTASFNHSSAGGGIIGNINIAGFTLTPAAGDTTIPVITLVGADPVNINQGATYTDAGATATDDTDGTITGDIATVNPVDTAIVGQYTVTYNVDDAAGNSAAQVTRTVNVVDGTAATLSLPTDTTTNVSTILGATVDEGSTIHTVAYLTSEGTAPTDAEVVDGSYAGASGVYANDKVVSTGAFTVDPITVVANSAYSFKMIAVDATSNISLVLTSTFTTLSAMISITTDLLSATIDGVLFSTAIEAGHVELITLNGETTDGSGVLLIDANSLSVTDTQVVEGIAKDRATDDPLPIQGAVSIA